MSEPTFIGQYPPRNGGKWDCQCARCGSSCHWIDCDQCFEGYDGHDCGEDCCMCLDPQDNMRCQICMGHEGWWACLSSPEWCKANPVEGRDNIERGEIEWFAISPERVDTASE